ncbi:MAG TPA: hypothetical protein VKB80_15845 [Kofleriaceae bacterium]|nr:hypothetical protein [Kofleriaceae bacterium]
MSRLVRSFALAGVAALAAAAAPAACVPRPSPGSAADTAVSADDASAVTVVVVSRNPHPVELLLEGGARPERLGTLRGHGRTTFAIPWRALAGGTLLHLAAREIGGGRTVSSSVEVAPGARVAWTLESTLAFSSLSAD